MKNYLCLFFAIFLLSCQEGEKGIWTLRELEVPSSESFRGLHVVNDQTIWVSGSSGTILRSINGGKSWSDVSIGETNRDFRDIHAWSENEALVISIGDSARFYKTYDGGENWKIVYQNNVEGVFFDGVDFDGNTGYAFSDPINGRTLVVRSFIRGESWEEIEPYRIPASLTGEGGFAASGTGIHVAGEKIWVGMGAADTCRILIKPDSVSRWKYVDVPMQTGQTGGIYSLAFRNNQTIVAVGGSYVDSTNATEVAIFSIDGGETWVNPANGPGGFRSCVTYSEKYDVFVAAGRTGIDFSMDMDHWEPITDQGGYYACQAGEDKIFFIGRSGQCAFIELNKTF